MNTPSIGQIKQALINKGYQYLNDGKLFHLNIIGIRSASAVPNTFDDLLTVLFNDETGQRYIFMACTTKPGLFYLDHPDNANGVAILAPGQYLDRFTQGLHKGQYPCLVQDADLLVYRDNRRNGAFDFSTAPVAAPPRCGIEIHRADADFASIEVNNWSAGCQVVADPVSYAALLLLENKSIAIRGNKFSYTLLNEADLPAA